MKKQIIVITKNGKVYSAILEYATEKEINTKVISFNLEKRDEVAAMQVIDAVETTSVSSRFGSSKKEDTPY